MTSKRGELLTTIARIKDDVLLMFDDSDSAIARNWRICHETVPSRRAKACRAQF